MILKTFIGLILLSFCSSIRIYNNPGATIEKEFQTENGPVTLIVGKKTPRHLNLAAPSQFEVIWKKKYISF